MIISEIWIPIIAVSSLPIMVIGFPIARAFARRMDASPSVPTLSRDLVVRLERMEQAIDSIAIEIERISEGQRFTTKLLSERGTGAAIDGSAVVSARRES